MDRDLDGIYFRVERGGEFKSICFSDLTEEEIEAKFADQPAKWWKRVALHLKDRLNEIGDKFNIINEESTIMIIKGKEMNDEQVLNMVNDMDEQIVKLKKFVEVVRWHYKNNDLWDDFLEKEYTNMFEESKFPTEPPFNYIGEDPV